MGLPSEDFIAAPRPAHAIHTVDLPFRMTSSWRERGCELGRWQQGGDTLAWALFQPPWYTLDYGMDEAAAAAGLEDEVLGWGVEQMRDFSRRTGERFVGVVEVDTAAPGSPRTIERLHALGLARLATGSVRLAAEVAPDQVPGATPAGYRIRPTSGAHERDAYLRAVDATFGAGWYTLPWRERTSSHAGYRPELDLVAVDEADSIVGFCLCWSAGSTAQIEPIGVRPDHRGQGLGRALELAALAAVGEVGARRLLIDHGSANAAAMAMSTATGFARVRTFDRYGIRISDT